MMSKLVLTITLSASLVMGAFVAQAELAPKKTGVVEVIELESYPLLSDDETVDCEFAVTPQGMTKISGDETC
jgi:hypothetical protein